MNFSIQKSSLLKSGFAIAAIAIAVTNYSQSNKSYSALTPKIIKANAQQHELEVEGGGGSTTCISELNKTCSYTGSDGTPHTTTNARL